MKVTVEPSAVVVTPTIGKDTLEDCVASVIKQTYNSVDHLLVVDGADHSIPWHKWSEIPNIYVIDLPWNVGADGFYGHRVYAAISHLVNHDYVLFCDEDNWYDPSHVETCIKECNHNDLSFTHSLRRIHDKDGNYLIDDNCESLGRWPIYGKSNPNNDNYLIDTSSYCFKRDWLLNFGHIWHYGWGGDRRFLNAVWRQFKQENWRTTGRYTLNYRLDGNPNSVNKEFFEKGNEEVSKLITQVGDYPWVRQDERT
jgi:glycosyltransferase involved in cell wall biosynthesis